MTLHRDKRTGDYYTTDKKYMIEKGTIGWNACIKGEYGYEYDFSADTLKEIRESLKWRYAQM